MEKPATELEVKYQKLAAEYSKVRSQAGVLKKAVLDEQAKTTELNQVIRNQEQTLRKHDQEMESLIFRNEQLTKRISVLQQDLRVTSHSKKGGKLKATANDSISSEVLDEELQKKILENAQLLSSISDKDLEIQSYRDRIEWLEEKITNLEKELGSRSQVGQVSIEKLQQENEVLSGRLKQLLQQQEQKDSTLLKHNEQVLYWKSEAEKVKAQCDLLRSKPTTNEQLTTYYETQLSDMLKSKTLALSETRSLSAENQALKCRLENLTTTLLETQQKLDKSQEELASTNSNYQSQLDAMTEHLAAQNEKITQQCDEIQLLKHRLASITKK